MSQSKLALVLILSIFLAERGDAQNTSDDNARQIEFKSKSSATLSSFIDSGTKVRSGDVLFRLSSSQQEEYLNFQRDVVKRAESAFIEQKSRLAAGEAAKKEYVNGLYEVEKSSHTYAIKFAEQELELLKDEYDEAKKSVAPKLVLKRLTLQVDMAKHNLSLAKKKLEVLEKYTNKKRNIELDAGIQLAKLALKQTDERLRIEKRKLKRFESDIRDNVILVPEGLHLPGP